MAKVRINTLWSLEDVKPNYVFDTETYQVINTNTGKVLKVRVDKRGYPVVGLAAYVATGCKAVKFHKIIALSIIHNGPYELIEHLDDNPLNYNVSNLKFSTKSENMMSMYRNGITNHHPRTFLVVLDSGNIYFGTLKAIAKQSGIPRGTLYDASYGKWISSKHGIREICQLIENS